MLQDRIKLARERVETIIRKLEVPDALLKYSEIQVCGDSEEKFWYTFIHNGTDWDIVRETEVMYRCETFDKELNGFLHLSSSAVRWLSERLKN